MTAFVWLVPLLAAAPNPGSDKILPRLDGWKLQAAPSTYTPDTLFEYIDGGADAFLQFDFRELVSATYVNAKTVEIRADLYRHRDATRAFGIYSQERKPGSPKMPGKLEGIASPDHLEFVAGDTYVKLALPNGGAPGLLPLFAERIAAKLSDPRMPPAVLACFPERGKRPRAEVLAARNFLGHAFLHDAATAPYEIGAARFRLFVIEGKDAADAAAMVAGFRGVAKLAKTEVPPEGTLTLKDPLNGEVALAWNGRWVWGAVDDPSPDRQALVEELGRAIRAGTAGCARTTP